jgi:hypothetical protein
MIEICITFPMPSSSKARSRLHLASATRWIYVPPRPKRSPRATPYAGMAVAAKRAVELNYAI